MPQDFKQEALDYHRSAPAGKIEVIATKPLANQHDLSLAYSPGVAYACEEIAADPSQASEYTARGNLVGVITNGTAVLGLGNIGPLASKPVMEGKGVLFKSFSGINVFDIEIKEEDPYKLVEIIASLEPTFGGINLEDIKAPECFIVEEKLRERLKIPVFHDDQHGTAIIVAAAMKNALEVAGKKIDKVKLVTSGAGAAALSCLGLLVKIGLPIENIFVTDIEGVVYKGRTKLMDPIKEQYAQETKARSLAEVLDGADIFLGLSAGGVLKPDMIKKMTDKPIIFALANPTPEIHPDEAKKVRPDAIIATGRTDFPNQVNNVLCFPFIFRGALDVGATTINEEMKIACVKALSDLAKAETSDIVARAYGNDSLAFGADYLIPKPFDPRLISKIAPAVAKAAIDSGVATKKIDDFKAYENKLIEFVFRSSLVMRPIFASARNDPKRLVFSEGEDERVLRAVQVLVDDHLAKPILIGRKSVVDTRIKRLNLRLEQNVHFELCDPEDDPRYPLYWRDYQHVMERKGVSPEMAKKAVRTNTSVIAALMVHRGEADAMIANSIGRYQRYLHNVVDILGLTPGIQKSAAMNAVIMPSGTYFICDTYVNPDPTVDDIVEMTCLAADEVCRFGITPKVALLSHSSFGTHDDSDAEKMRQALRKIRDRASDLEIDGEMHADAALDPDIRSHIFPNSTLTGRANLLIMPNLSAANICYNLMKSIDNSLSIGPMLLGVSKPVHILTPSVTVRGIINMSALAVVDAQRLASMSSGQS